MEPELQEPFEPSVADSPVEPTVPEPPIEPEPEPEPPVPEPSPEPELPEPESPSPPCNIVDEDGNVVFRKGEGLNQTSHVQTKTTKFYQLLLRRELFRDNDEKERIGSCSCQLEKGLPRNTEIDITYSMVDGTISFTVSYTSKGKQINETRVMRE